MFQGFQAIAFSLFLSVAAQATCTHLFVVRPENPDALELHTARLKLAPLGLADIGRAYEMWNLPEVVEHTQKSVPPAAVTGMISQGSRTLSQAKAPGALINFGIYLQDELIGIVQLFSGQEELVFESGVGNREEKWGSISYVLRSSARGGGYATEAAGGVIHFAFETLGYQGIHAQVLRTNSGSQSVLTRLGFKMFETADPLRFHSSLKVVDSRIVSVF